MNTAGMFLCVSVRTNEGMNENHAANVLCPYYKRHSTRKNAYEITCEQIMEPKKLGFKYEQRNGFKKREDMYDYMGLFCTDLYEECPVYKAIEENRKERHGKTKKA